MKIAVPVFAVLAFFGLRSFLTDRFQTVVTEATTNHAATCLEMLGNTTREEKGATYLVGTIRNNCDRPFGSVTIAFKQERSPEDKTSFGGGAPIFAYSNDLKPNESREFKSAFPVSKNTFYHFDGINAF